MSLSIAGKTRDEEPPPVQSLSGCWEWDTFFLSRGCLVIARRELQESALPSLGSLSPQISTFMK